MDNKTQILLTRRYENTQVDYTDCCTTVIRKGDFTQHFQRYDSQKILKNSRQKGISLTSKSLKKFDQYLLPSLKLKIKSSDEENNNIRSSNQDQKLKDINNSKLQRTNNTSKKLLRSQRCIDYKNKKILQHNNNKNDPEDISIYKKQKDNQLESTRKNTFRTNKESFLKLSIIKNAQFIVQSQLKLKKCSSNQQSPYKKLIEIQSPNKNIGRAQRGQKTLSKLYQNSKGIKFETVYSVQSQNGDFQSSKQSIIEPFTFVNHLTQ